MSEIKDIGDILNQPVQGGSQQIADAEFVEVTSTEFEPETEVITNVETIDNDGTQQETDFAPAKDTAESIVNTIDGLQSSILTYFIENKTFSDKEAEMLENMDKSGNTAYSPGTPEAVVMVKWKRLQAVLAKIPFDNGEKRRLTQATTSYVKTVNLQLTPLQTLMLSWSEVIVKRSAIYFKEQ